MLPLDDIRSGQIQFHLSQLRMSRVGHLHGLIYDGVLYYGIYGVCIGILACRGLSLVSSPLHAMKSQSQIQSSAAVNLEKMPSKKRTDTTTTTTTPMTDAQHKALIAKELLMHWQNVTQTEAGMAMTVMIQGVTEEGECLLLKSVPIGSALTWWNSYVKTIGHDVAYAMTWKALKKMMTDKYCPRGEIKKLEIELWNLKVKGTDVESYSQRFQELALMCSRMFPEESDEVEKYVGGLADMIQGSVMASKPKKMRDTIEFTT
ncbi:reverse transcriptase domain-containing protein [Tanacetum coccineum]